MWAQGDLNPRPTGYEPVALTRLSYGPNRLFRYENMYKGFEKEKFYASRIGDRLVSSLGQNSLVKRPHVFFID